MKWLLILLSIPAMADPPFQLRGTQTNQAIGGLNSNFIDQNTLAHDQLTKTITPASCPSGQSLVGASYNNGYIFGGTCSGGSSSLTGSATIPAGSTLTISGVVLGTINKSTFSVVPVYANSAVTLAVCVPGSTVTFTPNAGKIDVVNFGNINQGNSGQDCAMGFLINGGYPPGFSPTSGLNLDLNGYVQNASFVYPAVVVTPGVSVSVCLTVACAASGPTVNYNGSTFATKGLFGMREAH